MGECPLQKPTNDWPIPEATGEYVKCGILKELHEKKCHAKKDPRFLETKSKFEGSKGPEMMKYPHSKATDLKKQLIPTAL